MTSVAHNKYTHVIIIKEDLYHPVPFVAHENYLAKNIAYKPIKSIYLKLKKDLNQRIKSRDEAHITIFTPGEFAQLSTVISKEIINELAKKLQIQQAKFSVLCLGKAILRKKTRYYETYFLIVESKQLENIRQAILAYYVKHGGNLAVLHLKKLQPHITIGYVNGDIYQSEGIKKDYSSCLSSIRLVVR